MTGAKRTAGHWFITKSGYDDNLVYKVQIGTNARTVAYAYSDSGDKQDEQVSNARLIAAAPDLLEALELIVALDGKWSNDAYAKAEVAISKATKGG